MRFDFFSCARFQFTRSIWKHKWLQQFFFASYVIYSFRYKSLSIVTFWRSDGFDYVKRKRERGKKMRFRISNFTLVRNIFITYCGSSSKSNAQKRISRLSSYTQMGTLQTELSTRYLAFQSHIDICSNLLFEITNQFFASIFPTWQQKSTWFDSKKDFQ